MGGSYSGTAVPHVNGPAPRSYQQPQNWASPAVSGRDLIVHRDVLRQVASDLAQLADELQATLGAAGAQAGPAAGAAGGWPEARQLAGAMTRAHTGVTEFTGQLRQAHSDMARRLTTSADRYDAAEQQISSLIRAATDPSATIVGSGGQDTPVQPGYGQNWTPQQRATYYRIQHIENMPGNRGPTWTGTYPITEDAGFAPGGSGGYTWQQVRSLLAGTDPGAISSGGRGLRPAVHHPDQHLQPAGRARPDAGRQLGRLHRGHRGEPGAAALPDRGRPAGQHVGGAAGAGLVRPGAGNVPRQPAPAGQQPPGRRAGRQPGRAAADGRAEQPHRDGLLPAARGGEQEPAAAAGRVRRRLGRDRAVPRPVAAARAAAAPWAAPAGPAMARPVPGTSAWARCRPAPAPG